MRFTFENYWPLLGLLAIPFLWWVQRGTMTDLSPKHLRLSTGVRSAIVTLLVVALMQPVLYRNGSYLSVVYLLDVSQSVAPAAIQDAIQWIRRTNETGAADHSRFIAFGSNAMAFASIDDLTHVEVSSQSISGSIDQSRTQIADALDRAIQSLAPNHLKRVVLISDGNENAGDLATVLPRLKAEQIPVYTVPLQARATRDVWIETILSPSTITAEEQFPLEVHVYSQVAGPCEIELKLGDKVLATRSVQLTDGLNRIAFQTTIEEEAGPVVLEASANVPGDPFTQNNIFRQSAVIIGKPRVLYIEGYARSAQYLQTALTTEGFTIDVVAPESIPPLNLLDTYDAVILSDVDKNLLSDENMQGLMTYVRDLGGGLILAGGESTYGEGGYSKSTVEEILPVTFETKKTEPQSMAMVLVLDRSGSMAGLNMEMAKAAAKAAVQLLKPIDQFGLVAFDFNFYWPIRVQSLSNKEAILRSISLISPGGETNIFPALREAYVALSNTTADVKHVILLSDGQTFPEDFEGLTTRMAQEKITVSTVTVGDRADRELMTNVAKWGNGRTYYLTDPAKTPQVFIDETTLAAGASLQETPFQPVVKKAVEAFTGIDFSKAPQLLGYVATKAKPTSEVLMESGADEPLLARWQYGLGKSVVFTSDVKDRWAVDWLTWDGYPKFWAQLVRETMRRQENDEFDFQVERQGEFARVSLNAIQKDGRFRNNLQTQVRAISPNQEVSVIDVPQVGPGAYETRVPITQKGSYAFRAIAEDSAGASRVLAYSYPEEYHFYPPDTEKLRALSEDTGGTFQPEGPEIFNTRGQTIAMPLQLWPWLTGVVLLLYILDVFLRRVRLFEAPLKTTS